MNSELDNYLKLRDCLSNLKGDSFILVSHLGDSVLAFLDSESFYIVDVKGLCQVPVNFEWGILYEDTLDELIYCMRMTDKFENLLLTSDLNLTICLVTHAGEKETYVKEFVGYLVSEFRPFRLFVLRLFNKDLSDRFNKLKKLTEKLKLK